MNCKVNYVPSVKENMSPHGTVAALDLDQDCDLYAMFAGPPEGLQEEKA